MMIFLEDSEVFEEVREAQKKSRRSYFGVAQSPKPLPAGHSKCTQKPARVNVSMEKKPAVAGGHKGGHGGSGGGQAMRPRPKGGRRPPLRKDRPPIRVSREEDRDGINDQLGAQTAERTWRVYPSCAW
jgi:hypothetical protein